MVELENSTTQQADSPQNTPSCLPAAAMKANFSLVKYILLSLITAGIYGIYVFAKMGQNLDVIASRYDGRKTMNYWLLALIVGPITFGIGYLVWYHKFSGRLGAELERRKIDYSFGAGSYWLWNVLGVLIAVGPLVYAYKAMKAMDLLIEAYNTAG